MIRAGEVMVNGQVMIQLGAKADPSRDHIKVRGRLINPKLTKSSYTYYLLNKPKGYLSTKFDPKGRPIVTQLLPELRHDVHPVGRLDFNSEGLLLLTNDGDLTHRLTAARYRVSKRYVVKVKGIPGEKQLALLRRGMVIDERKTAPVEIQLYKQTDVNTWFAVTLKEGRNQQIRKMFEKVGHSVLKLRRVAIGPLSDASLLLGGWRRLTPEEVHALRQACGLEVEVAQRLELKKQRAKQ